MKTKKLILIEQFCTYHKVPVSFINTLFEYDLIEVVEIKEKFFLEVEKLHQVEKMMRLHYDLGVNFEGIDAIYNLLKQLELLQSEVMLLNNKLSRFKE